MTYTPNVPTSGQTLGNSRPIINSIFMFISEDFGVNHVNFGLANAGCHIHADLLAQASDPNPLTTIVSHYSKQIGGITEWYFQREGTAGPTPGPVIQMSTINGIPLAASNGQTFLPGGLVMKFGNFGFSGGGRAVAFNTPFLNNVFSLVVTVTQNGGGTWFIPTSS